MQRSLLLPLLLAAASPAAAQSLQQKVETTLAEAATGTRFGLVVTDGEGREIVAVNPDGRFIPASNTKMFTTAAAYASLPGLDQPDAAGGAAVRLEGQDLVLEGNGDARLSSADDCKVDCLAMLADAVAAKTRQVRNIIGDDTRFPDQRWSPGMSWNNIPSSSGTGISALTLDDNELVVEVTPGAVGAPAKVALPLPYFTVDNRTVTVPGAERKIGYDRAPNSTLLRLTGTIGVDAKPDPESVGIDDPAHYAAWRLKGLLAARGVKVTGAVSARHRPLMPEDDPRNRAGAPAARPPVQPALAKLTPSPLAEDVVIINKVSQNLHAELLLRRTGLRRGTGSIADGVAEVRTMLETAGVPRTAWDLSDGSGMSSYNRVAPRGAVKMLRWIAAQPWGAAWRASLPVAGVDGTLRRRFKGTALEGRLFAKTGTLNATNALSGYLIAKSGKTLTFSAFANDVPADAGATKFMDAALVLIAEAN
ncbi:D-alanyl-D-alanine carboxypeptidase/D-alanyl-D-alanine-endopeptidase (penicillin-binding protein 4) [Sphingomonas naasensis]|uniref:D-alanyl-D-alanine carboxypeptidase/D-alanyl-D-alanine-endopeptidase n=1 Tax=Sphingomonas naasensis TaxID=1344951 RepID=A0A4S1WGS4_9SPHN|nr:D-alanyl-D-alanine carboxypeptidase/D-alanyl-D-alanine-endopeptidase [Sphingomonas naasensis]NIJ22219.1 D-alanyl-D-alanine carboxypeptidase/D-alanyl-D-alanine-endopeptidase (penicillin-binding protein 4) [Sphingomonas naasensis]TGX40760.1 D-alanyl-D-alanine carboxypeptidase/D-alanyl-D-alanine-endopeptidase [Sphingomonas naasensis]